MGSEANMLKYSYFFEKYARRRRMSSCWHTGCSKPVAKPERLHGRSADYGPRVFTFIKRGRKTAMEMEYGTDGNAAVDMSHILLVEDEPSVANGLRLVLDDEGYRVDWAANGKEALEKFRGNGFNLVVADLRLPDVNGMEVIKEIKAERPETEVVVITGYPSVETAVASAKMGVRDYLRKPFTDDEFKEAVQNALKVRRETGEDRYFSETEEGRLIQKREVLNVLNRTSEDKDFWREVMEKGSEALRGYQISNRGKAAISSGDLRWINENVGELTQKQLRFVLKRMEREAW
jgi:DNA-binding response OmpR family regulator